MTLDQRHFNVGPTTNHCTRCFLIIYRVSYWSNGSETINSRKISNLCVSFTHAILLTGSKSEVQGEVFGVRLADVAVGCYGHGGDGIANASPVTMGTRAGVAVCVLGLVEEHGHAYAAVQARLDVLATS